LEYGWLFHLQHTSIYILAMSFLGMYPMVSGMVWVVTALIYRFRRERQVESPIAAGTKVTRPFEDLPFITIIIPAFCEEKVIARAIRGCLRIDYPKKEIIVVDDGSPDGTSAQVAPFVAAGQVRLLRKLRNEGKAMGTNDAIAIANGELIMVMDADAYPDRDVLKHMVQHFQFPRVAAVTGNPRVANRVSLLAKLQALEFSSTVSLMRRAQRVWGRIMTISGIVGLFRKSYLEDVGLYSPEMSTEDIDMTWKLQRSWYDARYEPRSVVWMQVPSTLRMLYAQRRRWAFGMAQVLRRHATIFRDWRMRRMYPVFIEATLSIIWAALYVILSGLYIVTYYLDPPPMGADPVPLLWGLVLLTTCLIQLFTGLAIDQRYEPGILGLYVLSPIYPMVYWLFSAATTLLNAPRGVFSRKKAVSLWNIERE
jgi:poly-beta-1,6-N-acetyl-D-glucosamine synthase